ncbi:hypothetical protein [Vibrio barjaei]|uniref:hypothetical protein n=1 Tax=Vibrio barjaei TaxID=1676683 RepID=UPI00228366E5|nr:hypothetical protein [Vibrio barjaei]MCY9872356.1 hypothetical protein [Vibrio barjaei]
MWSEFEAKVAVGIFDSVAVMLLEEREVTAEGEAVVNGCDDAVKSDMETEGAADWFHYLRPKGVAEEVGIYLVKARVKFDEDSADYYNVLVYQIR